MRKCSPADLIDAMDSRLKILQSSIAQHNANPVFRNPTPTPTIADIGNEFAWNKFLVDRIRSIDYEKYDADWPHVVALDLAVERLNQEWHNTHILMNVSSQSASGNHENVFKVIYDSLLQYRDIAQPDRWHELGFLRDREEELLMRLCSDLDEAHSSLVAQNWKAATVVSASVMEALLSWWIKEKKLPNPHDKLAAMIELVAKVPQSLFDPPATMDPKYDRSEADSRKGAAMCAANYRNLIHAEKAERLKATCSRASAWQTFGATLTVAEAIGKKL
jgi:hypothetical protein